MCRLRDGYGTGVLPPFPVKLFGGAVAGEMPVFRCKKAMIFARKSRVFDRFLHEIVRFSRIFGVLFLPIRMYRTGWRPGILFDRAASSIAGATVARCAVSAAARIRVYGQQVGKSGTLKGWPPGLLASTVPASMQ